MQATTSSEQILQRNTIEANIYASRLLLVFIIIDMLSYGYYIAVNHTIDVPSSLIIASAVLITVCMGTYFYVQLTKGKGALIPHIIIIELLCGSCTFSLGWHVMVWPCFLLGLVYSVRYCNITFTAIMGVLTSIGMIISQFLMIPFGSHTGYINMNFFELAQDASLDVKAEYTGLYKAVINSGLVSWDAVYAEAFLDSVPNLLVMVGITIALCSIAKYNRRIIKVEVSAAEQKAKSEQKSQFLFNMSHDIRTPMNAVMGFTELLKKNIENQEKALDYVEKIRESNDFLLSLVNNVLDMARIESGKTEVIEQCLDVSSLLHSFVPMLEVSCKGKGIHFSHNIVLTNKHLMCDEVKTAEIHQNIISNAIKYTNAGGSIRFEVSEIPDSRPGYVIVKSVISDTGIGISKEFLPHIFESFEREKSTTDSKVSGTGLGMAITKSLIDLLQGSIIVNSEQGKGTKVTILIPYRIPTKQEMEQVAETEKNVAVIPAESKADTTILLAEDNDLNAEISMSILNELGYQVERAVDGIDCIKKLEESSLDHFKLILMDIQMPNMNGLDATRAIRKMEGKKSKIPIVAVTANAFEEDRQNSLKAGMNGHLSKPINVEQLSNTIGNLI